jgi:hypothetical protein
MLCPRRFALDLGVIRFDIAKVPNRRPEWRTKVAQ